MAVTPDEVRAVEGEIAMRVKEFDSSTLEVRTQPASKATPAAGNVLSMAILWWLGPWASAPGVLAGGLGGFAAVFFGCASSRQRGRLLVGWHSCRSALP